MNYLLFYEKQDKIYPVTNRDGSMAVSSKERADDWMAINKHMTTCGTVVAFFMVPLDAVSCVDKS